MDGLCWFPRLMRWQTSKGEVSPVFEDIAGMKVITTD